MKQRMSEVRLIDANALKQMLPAPIEDEYKYVHKIIDNAPTITPDMAQVLAYESGKASADRPTGEWIFDGFCFSSSKFKCSICHYPELEKTNYCPTCGAKMEGGRE